MAVLPILQYPNPRLKILATKVEHFCCEFQDIVNDMFDTLYNEQQCAGLAATQLDILNPPHVTVIDFSEEKNQPLCLVNAEITAREGETYTEEGCMSITGKDNAILRAKVRRAEKITVSAQDRYGDPIQFTTDGFMAKCIQHELDHLAGILFIDHLSPLKRGFLLKSFLDKQKSTSKMH